MTHTQRPTVRDISLLLSEARMVLPGIQALFGFQLIGIFSDGFRRLTDFQRTLHFVALLCSAVSASLVMAPAAFHRIAEREKPSGFFMRMSSLLIATAMAILLAGLCMEIWVVAGAVFHSLATPIVATAGMATIGILFWFVWPLLRKKRKRDR